MSDALKARQQAFSQAVAVANAAGAEGIAEAIEAASKLPPGPPLSPSEMRDILAGTAPTRPITKEEEAVIEAAKSWVRFGTFQGFDEILHASVRALTAPKAVRPEEVERGTRFKFEKRDITGIVCGRLEDGTPIWRACNGDLVRTFRSDDRIIPVPLEEE